MNNYNDQRNFLSNSSFLGTRDGLVSHLITGGQLGYGYKAGAFDAATPLAFSPAVICVFATPTMYDDMPDDTEGILRQTIKAMFECHAKSVTGIDINYTMDTGSQPIGHDGQELTVPTQSKRQAVNPAFTYPEVTGNLVWNLHRRWLWDINDPDTNAGLEHMNGEHGNANLAPFTMSTYSVTFIAIQYDQTQHPDRIIDAAVYTNVWPTTTTELGMERQIGTTSVKERPITYTGYVMHNDRTRELGCLVAHELDLRSERYRVASPNSEGVSQMLGASGYAVSGFQGVDQAPGIVQDGDLSRGEATALDIAHSAREEKNGDEWNKVAPDGADSFQGSVHDGAADIQH